MNLDSFLCEEKSVKITGIKPYDWYVMSKHGEPYLVYQCQDVTEDGKGVIKPFPMSGQSGYPVSAMHCHKLDPDYDANAVRALQERALKDWAAWKVQNDAKLFGRKPMGQFADAKR